MPKSRSRSPDGSSSKSRLRRHDSSRRRSPDAPPSKSRSKRVERRSRSRSRISSSKARSLTHQRSNSRSPRSPSSKSRTRKSYRSISPKRAQKSRTPPVDKPSKEPEPKMEGMDPLRTCAGRAYIPPAKLKLMQTPLSDKSGEEYQRRNWERLKKKIHGLVNKVSTTNLVHIVRELLQENVIRGQQASFEFYEGLLASSIIQALVSLPAVSDVYAALVSIINSKFPHIGELVLRRLIVQFKGSFRRNDKVTNINVVKFIAHLINQLVAHEIIALEIMIMMLETPTNDSVEVSIAFLKVCGAKLFQSAPTPLKAVFERLRAILTESAQGTLDKRIQYMIEVAMSYPPVVHEFHLIDVDDQITHTVTLENAVDPEDKLNVFKFDPEFEKTEALYDEIRKKIIVDEEDSNDKDQIMLIEPINVRVSRSANQRSLFVTQEFKLGRRETIMSNCNGQVSLK